MKLTSVARQGIKAALWVAGGHQSIAQGETAFLIYHSVSGRLPIELDLAPAVFERQLAYLAAQASVVDFERAIAQLTNGQQGQPKHYVLTFDDGYRDFYTTVFPLLQRWQLPAILYVNSGFVEEGVAYPMLTYPHLPVAPVTWAMLGEMVASGLVTLGAHTHTHPRLTECNAAQIEEELARPIELFRRELGIIPQHFCYPQARWNPTVEQLVQKQYRTAVIGTGAWATAKGFNPYRIPRLPIRRSDNWLYFQAKVKRKMANEEAFYARLGRLRGGHG